MTQRIDTASRLIKAPAHVLYRAFLDPLAVASWRPPKGMTATVHLFEPQVGGAIRMTFTYDDARAGHGKTSQDADVFAGRFVELVPDQRIVERVEFQSDDPAFAGAMTVTTTFAPTPGGTLVTFACGNVPSGISAGDHQAGMASSLANLAAFAE